MKRTKRTKRTVINWTEEEHMVAAKLLPSGYTFAAWGRLLLMGDPGAVMSLVRGSNGLLSALHFTANQLPGSHTDSSNEAATRQRRGSDFSSVSNESGTRDLSDLSTERDQSVPTQSTLDVGFSDPFVERLVPVLRVVVPFDELTEGDLAGRILAPLAESHRGRAPLVEDAAKRYSERYWASLGKRGQAGKRRTKDFPGFLYRGLVMEMGYLERDQRKAKPDEVYDANYECIKQEQRWMEERMAEADARRAEREEREKNDAN